MPKGFTTAPTPAYIKRVWEIVHQLAGFELGEKTHKKLAERIEQLYGMGLDSTQAGPIVHHEWKMHRDFSRKLREALGNTTEGDDI